MRTTVILALLVFCFVASQAEIKPVVCFWESWAAYRDVPYNTKISDIPAEKCTHIVYAFVGLDEQTYEVKSFYPDSDYESKQLKEMVALKQVNPNLKISVSIGGWGLSTTLMSKACGSEDNRKKVATSIKAYVDQNALDGIDIDWEYPGSEGNLEDKPNFAKLLVAIREAIGQDKILTISAFSSKKRIELGYDVAAISSVVNYVHVMSYDLRDATDKVVGNHVSLHSSSLEPSEYRTINVAQSMANWAEAGCPKDKLLMGIAFYGRSFTLAKPGNHNPGARAIAPGHEGPISQQKGALYYYEICTHIKQDGWCKVFDYITKTPYTYQGDQWVGFENPESIKFKTDHIAENGYGGAFCWAVSLDDSTGACGEGKNPLLTAVHKGLEQLPKSNDFSFPSFPFFEWALSSQPVKTQTISTQPPADGRLDEEFLEDFTNFVISTDELGPVSAPVDYHGEKAATTTQAPTTPAMVPMGGLRPSGSNMIERTLKLPFKLLPDRGSPLLAFENVLGSVVGFVPSAVGSVYGALGSLIPSVPNQPQQYPQPQQPQLPAVVADSNGASAHAGGPLSALGGSGGADDARGPFATIPDIPLAPPGAL